MILRNFEVFTRVFTAMRRSEKIITTLAMVAVMVCTLASAALGYETLSGRLEHIQNPDYRGYGTVTELPLRMFTEPAPDAPSLSIFTGYPQFTSMRLLASPTPKFFVQLNFSRDELEYWLGQPQPRSDMPMVVTTHLNTMGINIMDMRIEPLSDQTGDFYITIDRSVLVEMRDMLKKADDNYTFEVPLEPVRFNSAELALRAALRNVWERFHLDSESLALGACVLLALLVIIIYKLWRNMLYNPLKFTVILLAEDEADYGHWSI